MKSLKLIKPWMRLLLLASILSVSSSLEFGCAHVQVPVHIQNEPLYYLKGLPNAESADIYAVQMFFLTSGQTQITKAEWDAVSQGMACMPLAAFEDFNTEIGKLCSEAPCSFDATQRFRALISRLHTADRAWMFRN